LSREKMAFEVDSWESAIRKARLRIQELNLAIETFKGNKESGEPWPGAVTPLHGNQDATGGA
jgi:hypothetical protein